jgi:hypothetical protein
MILFRRVIAWIAGFLGACFVAVGVLSPSPMERSVCLAVGLFMLLGGIGVDFYLQAKRRPPTPPPPPRPRP